MKADAMPRQGMGPMRGSAGRVSMEGDGDGLSRAQTDRYADILGGADSAKELAETLGQAEGLEIIRFNEAAGVPFISYNLQPQNELYEMLHAMNLKSLAKRKAFNF